MGKMKTRDQKSNRCCHIGVDLTHMIAGGGNGGIKPAILTFLKGLGDRFKDAVKFSFFTNSSTNQDVEFLVRTQDRIVCIALANGRPWPSTNSTSAELSSCPEFGPSKLLEFGIDVFYCPFGPTNRSTPDIPTVSMIADLLHRDYPFSISASEREWREEYFQDILADSDYVQCISQYTVDRLLENYRIKKDRVFFTHLPIDQRLRCGAETGQERPYFIYPANFWVHKNHEILLIAYQIYRQTSKDPWDLVLTGDQDERARENQELARVLQIQESVRFTGFVDEAALAQLLEGAGALVYPSLHEGFGIPLIEAMRFRKPIICSRSASVPEVVEDAAISVDGRKPLELAAAMVKLAEDPALRAQLVLRGEKRLRTFSIESEIDKLYEVFATAMRSNSASVILLRRLRRSQKWVRQIARTSNKVVKPRSVMEGFRECLRLTRSRLQGKRDALHRRLSA